MQIFVKSLSQGTSTYNVQPTDTILSVKAQIQDNEGVLAIYQRLIFSGASLEDLQTLESASIEDNATLHLNLDLLGGKKRKKKQFTTKKKGHHKHQNVKLAVLKFYTIDGSGNVQRARRICPTCGVGVFMAAHFDRFHCGKCSLTFKLDPSEWQKKPDGKKKKDEKVEEDAKGKDSKKKAAKKGK